MSVPIHPIEIVDIASLHPHPRNYNAHPDEQLAHLDASLSEHGFYRNIVIAVDGTILAGHGMIKTAHEKGMKQVPVVRLPIEPDSIAAIKVMTGDNETARHSDVDDHALARLLKMVYEDDPVTGLLGTGYDDDMYTLLLHNTRDMDELPPLNDPAEAWKDMPEFSQLDMTPIKQVIVNFASESDLADFAEMVDQNVSMTTKSIWFPEAPPLQPRDAVFVAGSAIDEE